MNHLTRRSFEDLLRDYRATQPRERSKRAFPWRLLYPSIGRLHAFGEVTILATNGFLALFDARGLLVEGHLDNFEGDAANAERGPSGMLEKRDDARVNRSGEPSKTEKLLNEWLATL